MSLSTFLRSTASLQRPASAPDASGAKTTTFATVTGKGALACAVWPTAGMSAYIQQQYQLKGNYVIALASDPGAKAGDRMTIGTANYLVNGPALAFVNGAIGAGSLYLLDCTLRT